MTCSASIPTAAIFTDGLLVVLEADDFGSAMLCLICWHHITW